VKQTKQKWPPAEASLPHLPTRLYWNPAFAEIEVPGLEAVDLSRQAFRRGSTVDFFPLACPLQGVK
jgi:hypothetical protein